MKFYFATKKGDLIDNYQLAGMAAVVDGEHINAENKDEVRTYATLCKGIAKEVKNPSVKYCLKNGNKVMAIRLYYEKHKDLGLVKCRDIVNEMEEKLKESAS